MKKIILLIVPFLIILSPSFSQNKTDKPNPYKGIRIKKIIEFTYQPKFDDYIEIPTGDSIVVTYNTLGYKIDSTTYRTPSDSSKGTKWGDYFDSLFSGKFNNHYEYDIQGRLTKHISSHKFKDIYQQFFGYVYEYDENGLIVKTTELTFDDKIESIWLFKYDSNNNLVDETKYGSKGELWKSRNDNDIESWFDDPYGGGSKIISKYDTKDRLIERVGYNYDGKKSWVIKYEFDQLKKIETSYILSQGENDTTKKIYIYDENGNLLETKEFGYREYFTYEINKYDSNGRLIQKRQPRFYSTGGISWWEYEYEEQGKLILIKEGSVDYKFEKINFISKNKKVFEYDYY